eukprot:gnl/TRDRNA2_/TRDRNA2_107542_c0_seq1.p1 gnl/TRDRNA2_/TRDRNA2_107542_c0~~gnl/TRDRNA2_/TRDRNA2_107542_c0_seq1.p1  ORF type:complete len:105 (+),score=2.96 gnl/TRDRNA2_/TRDRNA2_107542_c0_seq1:69-383(+)
MPKLDDIKLAARGPGRRLEFLPIPSWRPDCPGARTLTVNKWLDYSTIQRAQRFFPHYITGNAPHIQRRVAACTGCDARELPMLLKPKRAEERHGLEGLGGRSNL